MPFFLRLFALLAVVFPVLGKAEPLALWYPEPAAHWMTEALPIGNGRLGAMVFGGVEEEHLQFNENTLWTGDEADTGSYQDFGDLYVSLPAKPDDGPVTDYRRLLDLGDAVHRVTYRRHGVTFTREAFASAPAQVVALRFTADRPGAFTGRVTLHGAHDEKTQLVEGGLGFSGALPNGLGYEARLRVRAEGGRTESVDGVITFTGVDTLTVYLDAGTDYLPSYEKGWRGDPPGPRVETALANAAAQPWEVLRQAHAADYRRLFDRVALDLGATAPAQAALPTAARLAAYAAGTADPALEALFFQYGRYLLISSSRAGGLPANLQGLWNDSNQPPWRCDYHSNINVEMNYWPAEVTNLAECAVPFIDYVNSLRAVRVRETQKEFGPVRGWTVRTENNPFGGDSWEWNTPGSAWYAQSLWEHYAFGGDKEYLRTRAYPVLKEVCEFWQDRLKALPDGTLVAPMGFSPEQGPREDGVSFDQEIVWDLFTNYLDAARALGVDAAEGAKVEGMRAHLLVPKIGRWGQLQEWMVDRDDPKNQHRHVSHLWAVFPGHQISPRTTPDLAKAAAVSLNARGDGGTGWSRSWKVSYWARLLDGDHAYKLLRNQMHLIWSTNLDMANGGGVYANLLDAHPPFQIDGNFGATAGMTEMLLQSQAGELDLLPALPAAWRDGSVRGLRARGGYGVDLRWKDGRLAGATIRSTLGGVCRIACQDKAVTVPLPAGGGVELNGDLAVVGRPTG